MEFGRVEEKELNTLDFFYQMNQPSINNAPGFSRGNE